MKPIFKRFVSGVTSLVIALSTVPIITTNAEEKVCQYPYTMFASSNENGAITINAGNFGLNGRIATNGTVKATTNVDFVGYADENICAEMIYIPNRINSDFFSSGDVEEFDGDYDRREVNININAPISVNGNTDLCGNVTIQSGIKSLDDITITGDVQNSGNTVIYSKYGDIEIVCNNVNINGLIYAPFGNVNIKASNINLNNTMIIANTITIDTSSINANYSERFGRYFGEVSDVMEISEEDYQYFSDENDNSIPDFFENSINWKYLQDSDGDGVPDIIEKNSGTDPYINEEDYNEILDSYTLEMMYKNPLILLDSETSSLFIYGDLSNDLVVDVFDLVLMRKAVVDGRYIEKADLDGDEDLDDDDLRYLSDFLLAKAKSFPVYMNFDSDDDGISDYIEVEITRTSPHNADTDGDTISDFDEIVYTRTSPTTKYTRGLSVTDADDDPDEDNLTNKEEINYGTNPQLADSDFDGINDYDELKIYNTDPNAEDSDGDNITDGDEVELNLSPSSNKSDGITYDYNRTFKHTLSCSSDFLSYINNDENPYEVSIDIISAGNVKKALSIQVGEFSNTSDNGKIIGKSLTFSYDENLRVDTAKIYFKPKELDESIENYMIFEFFPETNYLLPVETKYTQDSAYVETSELGTYCLVNVKNIININTDISNVSPSNVLSSIYNVVLEYELGEIEVAFFVDISGALSDNLEETKKSIHDFSQALFEHSNNATVTIFGYYSNPNNYDSRAVQYSDSNDSKVLCSIDSVDEAINKISNYTDSKDNTLDSAVFMLDSLCNDSLFSTKCDNKYAFIISDSTYTFTNRLGYKLVIPNATKDSLRSIFDNNVHLNFLLSSDNYNCTSAVKNLKESCASYGFKIYKKSESGYFADTSFAEIYSNAIVDIKSLPIFYTCSIFPNTIPTNVERNAFINSLPPSYNIFLVPEADSDGNINFKEAAVAVGAAKYDENGNIVFKSLFDACDLSELTRKGYDQLMENQKISNSLIISAIQITPFSEKILYADNDGDGIANKDDPYPDEPFDERFMLVNMFNYIPNIDFVDRHIDQSNKCAYSKIPNPADVAKYEAFCILADGGFFTGALPAIQYISGWTDDFEYISSVKFGQFLSQFLWGKGKTLALSNDEMHSIIFDAKRNREHYSYNINQMRKAVEGIVTSENNSYNKVYITTKPSSLFKAACYKAHGCYAHTGIYYDDATAGDWGYSLGEAMCAMTAEAYKVNDKYCMRIRYYIIDNYEFAVHWELPNEPSGLDKAGHRLHETGLANEFEVIGVYEDFVTWNLGETLYPNDYIDIKLDEDSYNAGPTN